MPLPRRIKAGTRKPIIMKLTNYPLVQRLDLSPAPPTHPLPYTRASSVSILSRAPSIFPPETCTPRYPQSRSQGARIPIQFPNSRARRRPPPPNYRSFIRCAFPHDCNRNGSLAILGAEYFQLGAFSGREGGESGGERQW